MPKPFQHNSNILGVAAKGTGSNEEMRLADLLSQFSMELLPFDRSKKIWSGYQILKSLFNRRPGLVVLEGTGLAIGIPCILAKILFGVPYVVSSGDAVAPYVAGIRPLLGPLFGIYERLLCRLSAGFIGWTPYLVGRALTFGAPRAMTAAGWAPAPLSGADATAARSRVRTALGIDDETIVFGIVGSLLWNARYQYCYGAELVRAAIRLPEHCKVAMVVVGGGTGLDKLRSLAGTSLGKTIHLPGPVPGEEVSDYLAAFDVASLPQSVDQVGSFRFTTKLSEIVAAGVPVVTGQIPLAYDLDTGWLWRLPGDTPWSETYIDELVNFISNLTPAEIASKRQHVPPAPAEFDRNQQILRVHAFLSDLQCHVSVKAASARDSNLQSAAHVGSATTVT